MEKAMQFGAKVVACSDSNGYVYDRNGINLDTVKRLKEVENKRIIEYVKEHPDAIYQEGCSGIWAIPCDIALPCATQNEVNKEAAEMLVSNGVKAVGEGANMPSTLEAIDTYLEHHVLFAPAKAANAGGVAVSALEMAQNSARLSWTQEEVDMKLQDIMKDIYSKSMKASEDYDARGNLVVGANIAGFVKVANAMIEQGAI
jgi:glutamate dehydrogenase (NADP+)